MEGTGLGHLCLGPRLAIRQCCGDNGALSQGAGTTAHPYAVAAGPFQAVEAGGGGEFSQAGGICIAGSPAQDIGPHCSLRRWWWRRRTGQGAGRAAGPDKGAGVQSREAAGRGPDGGREITG